MTRPRKKIRPIRVNTTLPEDLMTLIEAHLKKKHGGTVRTGDLQKFLIERVRSFFLEQEYAKLFKGKGE